jgi:hypothetical protein
MSEDVQKLLSAYQVIASRRLGYDAAMWQVPALSFTAQAFLFTIALSAGNRNVARILAAGLALIIALISMQLMSKHRYHEKIDAKLLEHIEREMEVGEFIGCFPHARPKQRARFVGMIPRWFERLSSYWVWIIGLGLFALAAIAIIVAIIIGRIA